MLAAVTFSRSLAGTIALMSVQIAVTEGHSPLTVMARATSPDGGCCARAAVVAPASMQPSAMTNASVREVIAKWRAPQASHSNSTVCGSVLVRHVDRQYEGAGR